MRKDLNELKKCSSSKDNYIVEEDLLKEYESFRDCEIFRSQHKYKDAVDAVNLYYMDHNQKDSELFTYWEEDFYYWRRIYGNYIEALKNGFLIGKSYNEDLSVIEHALYNMKKYSDDEIYNETLTTCLKEFEDFKINNYNNNFQNITGNINKNPNDNPSVLNEKEKEYLTEYKECAKDGELSSTELRLLDKIIQSLGISFERAKEIENQYSLNFLNKEEKEFADEIKEILKDGVITDKERRLLNKLAKSLNISSERALEIESQILNK